MLFGSSSLPADPLAENSGVVPRKAEVGIGGKATQLLEKLSVIPTLIDTNLAQHQCKHRLCELGVDLPQCFESLRRGDKAQPGESTGVPLE